MAASIRQGAMAQKLLWVALAIVASSLWATAQGHEVLAAQRLTMVQPTVAQHIANGVAPRKIGKLLDAGADPLMPDRDGNTALHIAAMVRSPDYLKLLLARGLHPDQHNRLSGRTPLIAAMLAERDRQVAMLLSAGVDVGLADPMGNTPLHVAAQINEPRHVLALLKAGAPAMARNAQGQTFQRYLFMTPDRLLTAEALKSRRAVAAWLQRHGIALEAVTP